jgi:hypothetical protein
MKAVLDPTLAAQGVLWFSPREATALRARAAALDRSSFTLAQARSVDESDREMPK